MTSLVVAAVALTVVAAVRSTWSPCGLSMLSSMTPIAERGRGHRFWVTGVLYLLGAVAGGVTVGAVLAVGAGAVGVLELSTSTVAAVVVVAAAAAGASDLGIGPELPRHRRQVNEDWFSGYRRWVYASGFGWQIGNGFATYTTTAALYAVAVAAVAGGDPLFAFVIGVAFGTIRGLAIALAVPLTSLDAVRRMHARLDRWSDPSRILTGLALLTVAAGVALVVHPAVAPAVVAVAAAAGLYRYRSPRRAVTAAAAGSSG